MLTTSTDLEQEISNTLKLLEEMATNACLQDLSTLHATIEQAKIGEQYKDLIIAQECQKLAEILALDKLIISGIIRPPDEEDDDEEQQPKESIKALG